MNRRNFITGIIDVLASIPILAAVAAIPAVAKWKKKPEASISESENKIVPYVSVPTCWSGCGPNSMTYTITSSTTINNQIIWVTIPHDPL
jgi:hypothetical protein